MDVARAHYHADVIYFLPLLGMKKGACALWHELRLHQLGSRPTVFIPRWKTHSCILYQVCCVSGLLKAQFHSATFFSPFTALFLVLMMFFYPALLDVCWVMLKSAGAT